MIAAQAKADLMSISPPKERLALLGATPDVLAEIYRPDVNLVVWRRGLSAQIIAEGNQLLEKGESIAARAVMLASHGHSSLHDATPRLAVYRHLTSDICLLSEMFSCLFGLESIGIRLTTLTSAMCPNFHVDQVPCRLVTTYFGAGTDWLPHRNVSSKKMIGVQPSLHPKAQDIQQLAAGDVAILKGESWEGNQGGGVIHRSPAIEPEQRRLLLTFDMIESQL